LNLKKLKRKIQKLLFREQWSLLVCGPDGEALRQIVPPADRIWADPFPVESDGRILIFIEQQFYGSKGTLGYIELFGDLSHGPFCPVLEEPWHLSYPQVFRSNRHGSDEWYMVPESADCGQIRLYRAVSFPDRWEFVRELLPGAIAVDSTLFEHQGLWWLFTSQKTENTGFNSSLYAYSASVFDTDQWTPHRQNPVVTGLDNARMAGRVFRNGRGELIRPAQSCVREYGESLSLNRITALTQDAFQEEKTQTIKPERALHAVCTHTYNAASRYVIRDIKTRRFAPFHRLVPLFRGLIK